MKEILLNVESRETRLAILINKKLQDLVIEREKSQKISGNIYRGHVINLLENIQSAFIDIGEKENGFIHISDIIENTKKFQRLFDMDFKQNPSSPKRNVENHSSTKISQFLAMDQIVIVQVIKESIGNKGVRLTSNLSIPGRYLVLLPNTSHRGVSRKILDSHKRDWLKSIIRSFDMPQNMGLICRTNSASASKEQLIEEAHELISSWNNIIEEFHKNTTPTCLFKDSNLKQKAILTALDKNFYRILIDHRQTYLSCLKLYETYKKADQLLKIEFYNQPTPMFQHFNIEKEIEQATRRKIHLPSGGYLFFDRTEAMHTIDVNSGKSFQKRSLNANLEQSFLNINLEAAKEIGRQLRIRNIGGLIVCDFIDVANKESQKQIYAHLKESVKEDSAKCAILKMNEFGLIEMTRQRQGKSLAQILLTDCPTCAGKGLIKKFSTIFIELERDLKEIILCNHQKYLKITMHPEFYQYLQQQERKSSLEKMARRLRASLEFEINDFYYLNDIQICPI